MDKNLSPTIPILLNRQQAIKVLGGAAGLFDRAVAANWIRPAVAGTRVHYYRHVDIVALAERFCSELPPRRPSQERWLRADKARRKEEKDRPQIG